MTNTNLLPLPAYQTLQTNARRLLNLVLTTLVISSMAQADVKVVKVGDPTFQPSEFAFGPVALRQTPQRSNFFQLSREWVSDLLGDNHVLRENTARNSVLLPGQPHHGPYDQEARRAFAANGEIQTDVLLSSETSGRNVFMSVFALLPSEDAPLGISPDGDSVPVIPSEVYPIRRKWGITRNGSEIRFGTTETRTPRSLDRVGAITDDEGETRDYHELDWSHNILYEVFGGLSAPAQYEQLTEFRDVNGNGWDVITSWQVVSRPSGIDGDLSHNGELDMHDLNILTQNVAVDAINLKLDMNGDELVNVADIHYWVTDLKSTWIGDANLDGEFNSGDFVDVLEAGKYEFDEMARWNEGDWNGDERFDSTDFIVAFQDGGYEMGPRAAVNAVPEPSSWILLTVGLLGIGCVRRKL